MARTYQRLFEDTLAETFRHQRASFAELAEVLGKRWTTEQVADKARAFDRQPGSQIHVVHGGVVFYRETSSTPDVYRNVRRNIVRRWGPDNSMRSILCVPTARTALSGFGKWSQPDLVARVDRHRTAKPEVVYHAIEVERPGAFDIDSVYQAYECGRGAHFSWVFYVGSDPFNKPTQQEYMKRVERAAQELGVGLVHVPRPTAPSQWKTCRVAELRSRRSADEEFYERCGLTADFVAGRLGDESYVWG